MSAVPQSDFPHTWSLVESDDALKRASETLAAGVGSVGVDTERASGFRYSANAYLVQVSRREAGTFLFDPVTLSSFAPLADALAGTEWILHAASQDLSCLAELGLVPEELFDTELGARLLGYDRVGLGAVVERLLGIELEKAHSASDWSTRPLPRDWLEYAALDVTLLPDLRDAIADDLVSTGKDHIAQQEFDAIRTRPQKPPHAEPWRKLSGAHRLKSPTSLAVARELWEARDGLARELDVAPGRLLPDASIIVAALAPPRTAGELAQNSDFRGRASRSELNRWWTAVERAKSADAPPVTRRVTGASIPHHRTWSKKHPDAAERLASARELLTQEAERLSIPLENLLTPEYLRTVAWQPPSETSPEAIDEALEKLGARPWQRAATAHIISEAFVASR